MGTVSFIQLGLLEDECELLVVGGRGSMAAWVDGHLD